MWNRKSNVKGSRSIQYSTFTKSSFRFSSVNFIFVEQCIFDGKLFWSRLTQKCCFVCRLPRGRFLTLKRWLKRKNFRKTELKMLKQTETAIKKWVSLMYNSFFCFNQYKLKYLILQIQIDGGCRNGWSIFLWDTVSCWNIMQEMKSFQTRIVLEMVKKLLLFHFVKNEKSRFTHCWNS